MKIQWRTWFSIPNYILLSLYIPTILLLFLAGAVSIKMNIPFEVFTKDPLSFSGANPLTGVISNIGIIFWSCSAAICFFSFVFLKLNGYAASNRLFLFSGGMISLILLLDDCFMLHEVIYPEWLGIPEKAVMASYALILLAYLFQFRRKILSSDVTLLLVFFTTFGFSAVVDNLLPTSLLSLHFLLEDGAKFIGIMSWFGYQSLVCFTELKLTIVK